MTSLEEAELVEGIEKLRRDAQAYADYWRKIPEPLEEHRAMCAGQLQHIANRCVALSDFAKHGSQLSSQD